MLFKWIKQFLGSLGRMVNLDQKKKNNGRATMYGACMGCKQPAGFCECPFDD